MSDSTLYAALAATLIATGWLLPRLAAFEAAHPDIELRLQTHNNRIDLAGEGLDLAIIYLPPPYDPSVLEPLADKIRSSGLLDSEARS